MQRLLFAARAKIVNRFCLEPLHRYVPTWSVAENGAEDWPVLNIVELEITALVIDAKSTIPAD